MADYAIGDVQGCFDALLRLLNVIQFNEHEDRLWFVGDLINRGPQSLEVLRFIKSLPIKPKITLGNHDLYGLWRLFLHKPPKADDTLDAWLKAPDADSLGHWLRQQSIMIHDEALNMVMCHAGIAPIWSLHEAKAYALELEDALSGDDYLNFFAHMMGNNPHEWTKTMNQMERLRLICNYFTRMRFCDRQGHLELKHKGSVGSTPKHYYPWYAVPHRIIIPSDIVFGHWAALQGRCPIPNIHAIDTGCLWGGQLTALRLQDKQRFSVLGP